MLAHLDRESPERFRLTCVDDDGLRATLVRRGFEVAGQATLEAEAERVARFLVRGRLPVELDREG